MKRWKWKLTEMKSFISVLIVSFLQIKKFQIFLKSKRTSETFSAGKENKIKNFETI